MRVGVRGAPLDSYLGACPAGGHDARLFRCRVLEAATVQPV